MEEQAVQIVARAVLMHTTEFPGMEALGTDDKKICDAVVYALRTIEWARDEAAIEAVGTWQNTEAFGRLAAMVEYNVVDPDVVLAALDYWRGNEA